MADSYAADLLLLHSVFSLSQQYFAYAPGCSLVSWPGGGRGLRPS